MEPVGKNDVPENITSASQSARAEALEEALRKERNRADRGVNVLIGVKTNFWQLNAVELGQN